MKLEQSLPHVYFALGDASLNTPLVSVCIATYNHDNYIKDCVASVLSQSADVCLEIIIGDDGCGKETPYIIENLIRQHPGIIKYFRHKQNLGPSANYQFMIREARGQYIAHLDGDDFWLPGKIKNQLDWLALHPDSPACYSNAMLIGDDGVARGVFGPVINESVDLNFLLVKGNFLNHSSLIYRAAYKNIITNISGPFIDYKMHLSFAKIAPVGYVNAALAVYRLGSEHSMIRNTPSLVQDLYFEAIKLALSDCSVPVGVRRSALTHFWQSIALESIVKGRLKWFLAWAQKIRSLYPHESLRVLPVGAFMAIWSLMLLIKKRAIGVLLGENKLRILHER